ncbi:MAG: peptidase domain-containing ABC transporter [Planctomycetes bacterium]|nr:peptidase domain-containing ABC transporter [Planctomycetota bacterium]
MKRYACVLQHDQSDCGAAALATVAKQHGLAIGIGRIRELVGTDRAGTTLLGLLKGAERIGFSGNGAKGDWDGLSQVPLPAICHVVNQTGQGHFVVVHRITKDRIIVADPGQGQVEQRKDAFIAMWTGYALLLTPQRLQPQTRGMTKLAFVLELISPHRGILVGALVCALVLTALGLSTSFFVQHLVDDILVHNQRRALNYALVGMGMICVFKAIFEFIRGYFLTDAARKVDLTLIACYFRHVAHQPMKFFETRRVGEILSRVNDAMKIRQLISSTALTTLVDGLTVIIASIVMLTTDWPLALACLAFTPAVFGIIWAMRKPIATRQRDLMVKSADLEGQFVEDIGGIESIKAFGCEQSRLEKTESKLVKIARTILSTATFGLSLQVSTTLLIGAGTLTVLGIGAHRVLDGHITIGTLMFFYSLCAYLYGPMERLASVSIGIQDAAIALDRVWEILNLELEDTGVAKVKAKPAGVSSEIRFERVGFSYGYREPVLTNLDLVIPAGRTIALVGESGCGKSTLCKLLAKYYEPTEGRILVDGTDLRDIGFDSWRRKIGYVSQDAHIFNGTIADNIALGRPRASLARIARAAKAAGIAEFIESLPDRYQTMIGERGANLSGGQRQRLSIARAILANPKVFIFDEATSHLDTRTERAIQHTLSTTLRGRTCILIAHRLSTIRQADLIHVLGTGGVVESGTHDDLMKKGGAYRDLWLAQAEDAPIPPSTASIAPDKATSGPETLYAPAYASEEAITSPRATEDDPDALYVVIPDDDDDHLDEESELSRRCEPELIGAGNRRPEVITPCI